MSLPTNSIEMEQALLGGLMLNAAHFSKVATIVDPEQFYDPFHRDLAKVIWGMAEKGMSIKPPAVILNYDPDAKVGTLTIKQYLIRMMTEAVIDTLDAAAVVSALHTRTKLKAALDDAMDRLLNLPAYQPIEDVFDLVEERIFRARDECKGADLTPLWQIAERVAHNAVKVKETGVVDGMRWGLRTMDDMFGVLMPGDVVGIAAASGSGKTAMALQLLMANAEPIVDGAPIRPHLMIEMEMTASDIAMRAISRLGGPTVQAQRTGQFNEAGLDKIETAAEEVKNYPIHLDARGKLTLGQIRARVREAKRRYGIRSFVVDHLQLIKAAKGQHELDAIREVAGEMKDISKENDVVGIWLSQLTRGAQKEMKDWRFSDQAIYGGDQFKQGCDIMIGIASPSLFLIDREPAYEIKGKEALAEVQMKIEQWKNGMEVGGLKMRSGSRAGWRRIGWDGDKQLFTDKA